MSKREMTSTSKKQNGTITGERTGQVTKKSGKGNSHGFVSEVSAYLTVKPGHEEEARAAAFRFGEILKKSDWKDIQKTGLRDARLVNFDTSRTQSILTVCQFAQTKLISTK